MKGGSKRNPGKMLGAELPLQPRFQRDAEGFFLGNGKVRAELQREGAAGWGDDFQNQGAFAGVAFDCRRDGWEIRFAQEGAVDTEAQRLF